MAFKLNDRMQMNLFPPVIEDYVGKADPVRAYDAFVEALDFKALGIKIEPYRAGALEYNPKDMLKAIIYGYSYGIRSSRKLERACHHNLSFMWLMGGLKPDYRTLARFRKEYTKAIKKALNQCVKMCMKLDLIEGNSLFIDGSSFRANASIKHTWTKERCDKHLEKISEHIEKLVTESAELDEEEQSKTSLVNMKKDLEDKLELKKKILDINSTLKDSPKKSVNTTDPECVKVKSRQGTHAGYNAQVTVDEKHGLIVNSESADSSQDAGQLSRQTAKAQEVLNKKVDTVCADSGYHSLEDLEAIDKDTNIVVPSQKQVQEEHGHPLKEFDKDNFKYDAAKDQYICPAGKHLKNKKYFQIKSSLKVWYKRTKNNKLNYHLLYKANPKSCLKCPYFGTCTTCRDGRTIMRYKQEELKDELEAFYKSEEGQKTYKLRKEKAELPFGHMKRNLGAGQFLLRGRNGVDAELALLSTCFNIARMVTIMGVQGLILRLRGT